MKRNGGWGERGGREGGGEGTNIWDEEKKRDIGKKGKDEDEKEGFVEKRRDVDGSGVDEEEKSDDRSYKIGHEEVKENKVVDKSWGGWAA